MKKLYSFAFLATLSSAGWAQVTSSPSPLQEDSQNVIIYYHADQGNKQLMNLPATTDVYAHTGVITNFSTSPSDWKYAPTWGKDEDKYRLSYVSENLWELYIGDIRTFYGITNPDEVVEQLAFVFKTAGSSPSHEGKTEEGGDIFLKVFDSGLQLLLSSSVTSEIINSDTSSITFTATTTVDADITISVNGETIGSAKASKSLQVDYTFPGEGDYNVLASATADGKTVTDEKYFCYLKKSEEAEYPGGGVPQMGPVWNADGTVTFCLAAPEKESVVLMGEWNEYRAANEYVMNSTDYDGFRYFWVTVSGLDYDKMYGYYFTVDGSYKVGDPYARLVLDPWNDKYLDTNVFPGLPPYPFEYIDGVPLAILQGNINDYDWKYSDNFKGVDPSNLIIYELLFRDFTGTEGRSLGNGTVRQAIDKFQYLLDLGVNAIEVLPIMEFNGNNSWGYNPNFYFAPDKAYGTPDDYKEFIDLCHQHGIAVLLDMVFNQSDGLHPWYQMYGGVEFSPFYNYGYGGNNGSPHAYSVLNDWNQGYPLVQRQWHDVIKYWMEEYRFDGFRFDLVKGLGNNDSYANASDDATNVYNQSRIDRMIELQKIVLEINPNAYFINEDLATAREENAMAEFGQLNWAQFNNAGCQFAMGYSSNSSLNPMYAPNNDKRLWGSTVSYLESHDEQRLAYKQDQWGVDGVKGNEKNSMARLGGAAAQMLLVPGAHMIWQFSEMGNAQNTKNNDGGNNTSPKKVDWSLLDKPYHHALYESYCKMINIRNTDPDLFSEDAEFTMNCSAANWANGRTITSRNNGKELYTVINPNVSRDITVSVDFQSDDEMDYGIITFSHGIYPSFSAVDKTVTVPANGYVVIGSTNLADVKTVEADRQRSLRAYGNNGHIVVDYSLNPVSVYSIDGRFCGSLSSGESMEVTRGIYILSAGEETIRIIVR